MAGPRLRERLGAVTRSARAERARDPAPRYLFVAAVALLAAAGLRGIVSPPGGASDGAAEGPAADPAMESFAEQFARAYLAYDAARPEARERALAPFVPDFLGPDAGYAPRRGRSEVVWTSVAQNQEALAGGRIVTVAARLTGSRSPVYLAVPLERTDAGALALAGYPALVGSPAASTEHRPPARERVADEAVLETAERVLRNYLARETENLNADLAPGAAVTLPARALRMAGLEEVAWATETDRAVLVTVRARDRSGEYALTYELGLRFQAGRPLIDFIHTVPTAP
jgi:hypothetical protein